MIRLALLGAGAYLFYKIFLSKSDLPSPLLRFRPANQ